MSNMKKSVEKKLLKWLNCIAILVGLAALGFLIGGIIRALLNL